MVPALIDAIKSHGLALVVDRSGEEQTQTQTTQGGSLPPPSMFDGGGNGIGEPFLPKLPKGVDGLLKGNGVLRFNESIDV